MYLSEAERQAVLGRWGTGVAVERGGRSVADLIQAQAVRTPDAVAVRAPEASITHRELDRRSNQVAHHLLRLGAGHETLIGVSLRRTVDLLPVLLGIWKSGAGYLPLDPDLPPERRQRMLIRARCEVVVTTTEQRAGLGALDGRRFVLLDREREAIAASPGTPTEVTVDPAHLAYVMYTSGSTGTPKGVMIQHGGLRNYLLWTAAEYACRGTGGSPYFTSISFDLGIPSLFAPLLTGQPVHLLPDPFETADLGRLLIAGAPYSFVKLTPGHLNLLSLDLTPEEVQGLAGLVIAAGDSFPTELARRWIALAGAGGTPVATEYGPTEITVGNSGQPVAGAHTTELVPLGRPIPNTSMYVLTDRLEPVPIGVPGEIYVGGVGVARGYLGEPSLTADRFVPDPYGAAGSRLYRTGDRARWQPNGDLEFLGRTDHQVKVRGYRVELGEVQAILHRHPSVRSAVVITCRRPARSVRLTAFIVPASGESVDARRLRADLSAELPDHMVPLDFVAVDEIPLTANGKVDAHALQSLL